MKKYKVIPTPNFEKELKKLAKRYASISDDVKPIVKELSTSPTLGSPLGMNAFKIRVAIKSKNKGKSGGARIITYYIADDLSVFLLSIYDKSQFESISDKDIMKLIAEINDSNR